MLNKSAIATACFVLLSLTSPVCHAQAVDAKGSAEMSLREFKDPQAARLAARKAAERDVIRAVLKLKQNIDVSSPKVDEAIPEIVRALGDNMRTTFSMEADTLTARTSLKVDAAELTDIVRSMNLQNKNAMAAAAVVFFIDEYWGVSTRADPSNPTSTEVEYSHNKSSLSDTSAKASGSAFSDTSAKSSSAATYNGSMAASSKESAAYAANQKTSVAGSSSTSVAASDQRALAANDGQGSSLAVGRSTQLAGASKESFAGSSQGSVAASRSSDTRVAASVQSSSAQASDTKNVKASAFSGEQKNVQVQNDVVNFKTRTIYPEMGNAKPLATSLVSAKLAETVGQYGLKFTSEQDIRETGKGKMLIADIAQQGKYQLYKDKAAAPPYSAKYVVFGVASMRTEGKSSDGKIICSGELTYEAVSVAGGNNLPSATVNKRAQGLSDEDCRARLADGMANEVGQKAGNAATRELQMAVTQGSSYTLTLFSVTSVSRRLARPFEDALAKVFGAENVADGGQTDATRTYQITAKGGDFKRRVEGLLDTLGDTMAQADARFNGGNRMVVCVEGKCPASY